MTPMQLSLRYWRDQGYLAVRVEHWNPFGKVRVDLCGCDILAIGHGNLILVQTTTIYNRSARCRKLRQDKLARAWVENGGRIFVDGWRAPVKGGVKGKQHGDGRKWTVNSEELDWEVSDD